MLLLLLALSIASVTSQDYDFGSPCIIRKHRGSRNGVCTLLSECRVVQQNIGKERPTTCFYTSNPRNPAVCCPVQIQATTGNPYPAQVSPTQTPPKPAGPSDVVFSTSSIPTFDPSSKSERKCREYSKAVYQKVFSPALDAETTLYINKSVCAAVATPLVVGGEPAQLNEYPHMALLGYGTQDNPSWLCGGSLISENFVITAAHCLSSREVGQVNFVRLGELDVSNPNDGSQPETIPVKRAIAHPEYVLPGRYNDIALLELERPVTFSASIRPACIHRLKVLPNEGRNVKFIATGWGKIGFTENTSDKLLKVALSPIHFELCNKTYRIEATTSKLRRGIDDNSMLCAGELEGGKDTCQGDSGGPLQYLRQEPYCMYNVVGITSFGKFCGYKNSPAVYTRISQYMDWVESIVWPGF